MASVGTRHFTESMKYEEIGNTKEEIFSEEREWVCSCNLCDGSYISDDQPLESCGKDFVLDKLKEDGLLLGRASAEFKANKDVVLAAVWQDGDSLQYASDELKADKHVVFTAICQHGCSLLHASDDLRGDKEIALAAVAQNGWALEFVSEELKGDHEVLLAAVSRDGDVLRLTSEEFRGNKVIALAAMAQNGCALEFVSEELKGDKEVVLAAVSRDGDALFIASNELQNDREIVLAAVSRDGWILLELESEELLADEEIVIAAVALGGLTIWELPAVYQENKKVLLAALSVTQDSILRRSLVSIEGYRDFLRSVERDVGEGLERFLLRYLDDENVAILFDEVLCNGRYAREFEHTGAVRAASDARHQHWCLPSIMVGLSTDRDVVLAAVALDGNALQHASEGLKADSEVVLTAVTQNGLALQHAAGMRRSVTVLKNRHRRGGRLSRTHFEETASIEGHDEYRESVMRIVLRAVAQNFAAFNFAPQKIRKGGLSRFIKKLQRERICLLFFLAASRPRLKCINRGHLGDALCRLIAHGAGFGSKFKKLIFNFSGAPSDRDWRASCTVKEALLQQSHQLLTDS